MRPGPISSPVTPFDTDEEAIALANATDYGLGAYTHTTNLRGARHVADPMQAGMIQVNGAGGSPASRSPRRPASRPRPQVSRAGIPISPASNAAIFSATKASGSAAWRRRISQTAASVGMITRPAIMPSARMRAAS